MAGTDFFRPRRAIPRAIYDAFQREAAKRETTGWPRWITNERMAVFKAVNDERALFGKKPVSIDVIEDAERYAMGHVDYGAKLAYRCEQIVNDD